jgi:hypothetical protein
MFYYKVLIKITMFTEFKKNESPNSFKFISQKEIIRGPFAKFVEWRQCAAVMQREPATVMLSCSGGDNVVVE